ncbi:MAG: carboxypeptidase regulatory-like domain-containing protein [Alphaproteobacteria bacterium]|nr:carboxypeptidase regulatory-like domain-containing protein [Alphaproteobacteria bacterium]
MRIIDRVLVGLLLAAGASDAALALDEKAQGDVLYVTGGVGDAEIAEIKAMAPRYPLQILTADRSGQYVAGAHVTLSRGGRDVFDATLDGPYLLAKLAPGSYRLRASFEGRQVERMVQVGTRSQAITLHW